MTRPGPPLAAMMRRIAETPGDFLGEPRIGMHGTLAVDALLNDVLAPLGLGNDPAILAAFGPSQMADRRNTARLAAVSAWLLADEGLARAVPDPAGLRDLLLTGVPELSAGARAESYVTEPDRREELARTVLARAGLRPEGESAEQAADRLTTISAAERARLLAASREAEERARAVREALAAKAAAESADKWTRE